jgi:SagB-type dehydrogenase family enzyme
MKIDWAVTPPKFGRAIPEESLAELYHENSKLFPLLAREQSSQFVVSPFEMFLTTRGFRQYQDAPRTPLPTSLLSTDSLQDVMQRRRSTRNLSGPLALDELATLLRQSLGITAVVANADYELHQGLRAWPSAGGLYPLDVYIVASNVDGLAPGIYHFNVVRNELERMPSRPPQDVLRDGFFWQDFVVSAAATFLYVAVFERTLAKYGDRGYRLVLLDAGHSAQNVLLTAAQLHIGAVCLGGFCDDSLADDLHIDGLSEAVIYATAIGKPHD